MQSPQVKQAAKDDPFGLFEGELAVQPNRPSRFNSGIHVPPADEGSSSIESLDQLLDFGLSGTPSEPSSKATSPTTSPADVCVDLLEFCDAPIAKDVADTKDDVKDDAVNNNNPGTHDDHTKTAIPTQVLELVEEEGDLKPSALDALDALLGS